MLSTIQVISHKLVLAPRSARLEIVVLQQLASVSAYQAYAEALCRFRPLHSAVGHRQMAHHSPPPDRLESEDESLLSSDTDLVHDVPPQLGTQFRIHHLEPCSWRDFLQLQPPPVGHYDLVDGIVIWRPPMASKEHDNLIAAYVIDEDGNHLWTLGHPNSPSITATSSGEHYGLRHPDIIVARRTSDSSINSNGSTNDAGSAGPVQFRHPYRRQIKVIIEITSHSNRDEDLYVKWATYARSGVDLYIILDRGTDKRRNLRVIVGSAKHIPGYELSYHGDPDLSSRENPHRRLKLSRSGAASPPTDAPRFYRKVFEQNELVSCEYFSELKLSPKQLLNDKYMKKLSKAILDDHEKQGLRAQQAEREAKEAKHEAKEARHRAEKAESTVEALEEENKEAQKEILRLTALAGSATTEAKSSAGSMSPKKKSRRKH